VGTNPECAPESIDSILTSRSRVRIRTPKTNIWLQFWARGRRMFLPTVPLRELSDLPAQQPSLQVEHPIGTGSRADRFVGVRVRLAAQSQPSGGGP
jgi:hypothetical protein